MNTGLEDPSLRQEELITLESIFGEQIHIDLEKCTGEMHIPLEKPDLILVTLLDADKEKLLQQRHIKHLPPLLVKFSLPESYPLEKPPLIEVECKAIPHEKLRYIQQEADEQWETIRDQVLFNIIDAVQEKLDSGLDLLVGPSIECGLNAPLFDEFIAYNNDVIQKKFDETTFTCEICQADLKGVLCTEFPQCGHIFCNKCLRDFYIALIKSGDVEKVHCPDFNCSKEILETREKYLRLDTITGANFDFNQFRQKVMTPFVKLSLVHKILGYDEEGVKLYQRYTTLFKDHQHVLIAKLFPTRLVSCPRKNCPAMIFREDMTSRLVICRECNYAFCNTCRKSYHSDSIDCSKENDTKQYQGVPIEALETWLEASPHSKERNELRYKYGFDLMNKVSQEYKMDKLFNELLADESLGLKKCPTCDLIIQRSDGCNKMRCSSCFTSFCNLCGVYLEHDRPYDHFKDPSSACYGKLFEGMPGTEDLQD